VLGDPGRPRGAGSDPEKASKGAGSVRHVRSLPWRVSPATLQLVHQLIDRGIPQNAVAFGGVVPTA
jgi:hypothetical protein